MSSCCGFHTRIHHFKFPNAPEKTGETNLLQNFVQWLSFDDVVHSQPSLLFTLVCQLQGVRLDKTFMKLPDLWKHLAFHGVGIQFDDKKYANL